MNYSKYIYQVEDALMSKYGLLYVDRYNSEELLDESFVGRTYYSEKKICLNVVDAKTALYTIIHEGGHWLSMLKYSKLGKKRTDFSNEEREDMANEFGWELIKELKIPILKKEWIQFK